MDPKAKFLYKNKCYINTKPRNEQAADLKIAILTIGFSQSDNGMQLEERNTLWQQLSVLEASGELENSLDWIETWWNCDSFENFAWNF